MPQDTYYMIDDVNEEKLVLRKITGRKRKIDTIDMKNHFIRYFTTRLPEGKLRLLEENIIDFDNCNFNKLSYEILTSIEFSNWSKAWSSYKLRNTGEKKYRYYLSNSTNSLIHQVLKTSEFKNLSVDKIIQKLIMQHIMDK